MGALGLGIGMMLIGVPVAVVIGIAAIVALVGSGDSLLVVPQQFFANLNKFDLLAIPFFMLTGAIMDTGGVSRRLIDFAMAIVGFVRGGLGMVTVVASMFFADISGSATADTAAIGSIMIPGMQKKGYHLPYATALQSASGSLGLLGPQSMSAIIFAYTANVSVGKMLLANFIPGILVAISFMIVNYFTAVKRKYPIDQRFSFKNVVSTFREAIWALLAPIIILGGILGGICTPPEAGVIAVIYIIIVSRFVYKELNINSFQEIITKTIVNTTRTTFLLGLAFILGLYLTKQQIPGQIANSFLGMTGDKLLLLLLINVFLMVIHTSLETISSIIVVIPVFMPLIHAMNIDPIAFGVMVMVNSAIGINLPPVGFCLYTASSISGVPLEQATRAIMPFILTLLLDLVIVTLYPQIALFLPNLLHM
jgi:tripartite ATP-independent transporter DctM subunit